jgi:hypothetical protein
MSTGNSMGLSTTWKKYYNTHYLKRKKYMRKTNEKPKPTFDSIISKLPDEFKNEIIETDSFLKSLRPMKFKRVIDKNGAKITYVASDFGISYAVKV